MFTIPLYFSPELLVIRPSTGENLLKHKARMDKFIAEGERATLDHLNSPTRLPVGSMLEKKQA